MDRVKAPCRALRYILCLRASLRIWNAAQMYAGGSDAAPAIQVHYISCHFRILDVVRPDLTQRVDQFPSYAGTANPNHGYLPWTHYPLSCNMPLSVTGVCKGRKPK